MSDSPKLSADPEKQVANGEGAEPVYGSHDVVTADGTNKLHRNLKGRHMQMIAM